MTLAVARALYDSVTAQLADEACGISAAPSASEEMTMNTEKLTAETITDDQISALRQEAWNADDMMQLAICNVALGEVHDESWPASLTEGQVYELEQMSKEAARQSCASSINAARAMED